MSELFNFDTFSPKSTTRTCTLLFVLFAALAYASNPHLVTMSRLANHWYSYTLYLFAICTAIFELWFLGSRLKKQTNLLQSAKLFYASAVSLALTALITHFGSDLKKNVHVLFTFLFTIFAAAGLILIAKRLSNRSLGVLGCLLYINCVVGILMFLRNVHHHIGQWAWVALEFSGVAALMLALFIVASTLERPQKTSR